MTFSDVLKTAATIIISLGGGGAIVTAFSGFLGKMWADRALEHQKYEYSQLNIAFQKRLDDASRRLQVELDSLGLVHKLRTQEEFTRLSGLWIQIVNLRNQYAGLAAQSGFRLGFADREVQKQVDAENRQQFDKYVNEAQRFLAEQGLFIPKPICDIAQNAINAALIEQANFASFSPYVGENTIPTSGQDRKVFSDIVLEYHKAKANSFKEFTEAVKKLEELMRKHIAGTTLTSAEKG
jgi:hypothetical protein